MDRQDIIESLERRIQEQGGSKRNENYEKYIDDFKNPYEDDGSIGFKALRVAVMRKMAHDIFGVSSTQELAALEKSDIDKEMRRLFKLKEIELKEAKRKFKEDQQLYFDVEEDKKRKDTAIAIKAQTATEKGLYEARNPYLKTVVAEVAKTEAERKELPRRIEYYSAKGITGGKKRTPSAYNKFVSQKMKQGYSMKECAQEWKKKH